MNKSGIEANNTCVHLSIATAPTVPEPLCHITAFDAVGSSQTFSKHVLRDHDSEMVDWPDHDIYQHVYTIVISGQNFYTIKARESLTV